MPLLLALLAAGAVVAAIMGKLDDAAPGEAMKPRQAFALKMLTAMSRVDMKGIPKDLALALFSLETGYGTGDIFKHTNNPGSIKSTVGWTGKPSYKNTRAYSTLEEGISDWVRLISVGAQGAYKAAYTAAKKHDFKGFFAGLEAAGYEVSLNPSYSVRLANTYKSNQSEGLV